MMYLNMERERQGKRWKEREMYKISIYYRDIDICMYECKVSIHEYFLYLCVYVFDPPG